LSTLLKGNPLVGLNRTLDLAGQATGNTELEDETLVQTYDCAVSVARETSPGFFGGRYAIVFQTTLAAAGEAAVTFTPFLEDTAGIRRNAFPLPIEENRFELWIKGASARISNAGDGVLADAWLNADVPNNYIGLATVGAADVRVGLVHWDINGPNVTGERWLLIQSNDTAGIGLIYQPLNYFLPAGSDVTFEMSLVSASTSTIIQCVMDILILPIGTTADGG